MVVALQKETPFFFPGENDRIAIVYGKNEKAARAQFQMDFLRLLLVFFPKNYLPH